MEPAYLKALNAITRYTARRDHSVHELKQKMKDLHSTEAIEWAIEEAKKRRYLLEDQALAELWAKMMSRRGRSQRYISGYLRRHKLPQIAVDREDELAKIQALLKTKFKKSANFTNEERPKVMRFLAYRGFDGALIRRVANEKSDEE